MECSQKLISTERKAWRRSRVVTHNNIANRGADTEEGSRESRPPPLLRPSLTFTITHVARFHCDYSAGEVHTAP